MARYFEFLSQFYDFHLTHPRSSAHLDRIRLLQYKNACQGYKYTNEDGSLLGCSAEVLAASIIRAMITLMMEAASTSETSVNFYQTTRRYNPEDSHLRTRRRENLKSYIDLLVCDQDKRWLTSRPT
jgi:hypothetical protein